MEPDSQDWAELALLIAHITDLQSRYREARAMKRLATINAIEREIAETAAQRERLVNRLSNHLVRQVAAPLATPAEARI